MPGPAQDRGHPQHQLVDAERLGEVVVATGDEPLDPVVGCVACGQEQHRREPSRRIAKLPTDLEPVDARAA